MAFTGPQTSIAGRVGAVRNGDGTYASPRMGKDSETLISQLHGSDYQQAYDGNIFYAYSSLQTLSAVGTAITGLIVWNSSAAKNLVLRRIHAQVAVTSASLTGIALASTVAGAQTTAPTTTTAATKSGCTLLGAGGGTGIAYTIATCLTTLVVWPFMHNTAAIATTGEDAINVDLQGMFIVPPFTAVHLAALGAASASSAVTSAMTWEEVPV